VRLAFVNRNTHDYNADTPFAGALAGGESAQVYLAVALAARGHEVHLFNGTKSPGRVRGVLCRNLFDDPPEPEAETFDAIVVTNAPNYGQPLRRVFGPHPLLFAWPQDIWHPDPKIHRCLQDLTGPRDFILCVSRWYQRHIMESGGISMERTRVLGHAVSPLFEGLFPSGRGVMESKPDPETPILAFASSPYKGLEPALVIFRALREREPRAVLKVYSGFDHYPPSNVFRASPGRWQALYEACRQTPGVEMIGVVPQARLAQELRNAHFLFYPNVVPEGFGVVVAEAMAAGCRVVATALAALPETMAGFGDSIPLANGQVPGEPFIAAALGAIARFRAGDPVLAADLRRQVDHVVAEMTWGRRAAEFEEILGALQ
jgi:glycosyltransferase involved in cell wall biosynthesis